VARLADVSKSLIAAIASSDGLHPHATSMARRYAMRELPAPGISPALLVKGATREIQR